MPARRTWRWAAVAAFCAAVALLASMGSYLSMGQGGAGGLLVGGLIGAGGILCTAALVFGLATAVRAWPPRLLAAVGGAALAVPALLLLLEGPTGAVAGIIVGWPAILVQAALGAGLAMLTAGRAGERRAIALCLVAFCLVADVAGVAWLHGPGSAQALAVRPAFAAIHPLGLPDPSQPGPYPVETLVYGSGTDKERREFGPGVPLQTAAVDGALLIKGWSGLAGALRTKFWGFDAQHLPRNGRVWYPKGQGPFPLVLILHGNHQMESFSDGGYAYLAELLASRGFVAVSVDENFLNGSWSGNLTDDNPARAWLLLQHLQLWRSWNTAPDSPFYHQIDLENIALVGHSRGGEAAAVAALFNRMTRDPDHPQLPFDFGFAIKSVVAISPSDGQYAPAGHPLALDNVNYLLLWGSHDADMPAFLGSRQYQRVHVDQQPGPYAFKASVYLYGANHGQFNTAWGRADVGPPLSWLLNQGQLLSGDEQRHAAQVFVSAFLAATLQGEAGYIPLFAREGAGAAWLPHTAYVTNFSDRQVHLISDFEEDADPTTTTIPGGTQAGENLLQWQEQAITLRNQEPQGNHAVYLAWDTSQRGIGTYTMRLPQASIQAWDVGAQDQLTFALGIPGDAANVPSPDFTIELVDAHGASSELPRALYTQGPIAAPVHLTKLPRLEAALLRPTESVFQHGEVPLAAFVAQNPHLDLSALQLIRLRFDRSPHGALLLDDVGIRLH